MAVRTLKIYFNLLPLRENLFVLRFLVEHGFNFQKQYSLGVRYHRGNDNDTNSDEHLRDLFAKLVKSRKPIVLHNGLIDLIFLYHNLYAALPGVWVTSVVFYRVFQK